MNRRDAQAILDAAVAAHPAGPYAESYSAEAVWDAMQQAYERGFREADQQGRDFIAACLA